MFHNIQFTEDLVFDLEVGPGQPCERVRVHKGTRMPAQLRPYVVEVRDGPVEVADLFFEDGTVARMVPFAYLFFTD
jgi:hypothetical protein